LGLFFKRIGWVQFGRADGSLKWQGTTQDWWVVASSTITRGPKIGVVGGDVRSSDKLEIPFKDWHKFPLEQNLRLAKVLGLYFLDMGGTPLNLIKVCIFTLDVRYFSVESGNTMLDI
jgi:hypothetical protein